MPRQFARLYAPDPRDRKFAIGRDDFADLLAMDGEACLAIERRPAA